MGAPGAEKSAVPPKVFESIISRLKSKVEITKQLNRRSAALVSTFIGSPPILSKEDQEKAEPSVMLTEVLEMIENELGENLDDISQNLDRLEGAW